jgi:hypothetical protein
MADTSPSSISLALRMAKALALARRGKLRDAQAVIAGDRAIPDEPLALEAVAALATGEGDYVRARKLWELLRQRSPGHPEANRMISAIDLWQSRPIWMRYVPWAAGVAGALVLILMLLWALDASAPKPAPNHKRAATFSAPALVSAAIQSCRLFEKSR